jgi:hypothetical protein
MTSRDFCYWLQGYFELAGPGATMTAEQAEMVRRHLALVFTHEIDPSMGGPAKQIELTAAHEGVTLTTPEPAWKTETPRPPPPPPNDWKVKARC